MYYDRSEKYINCEECVEHPKKLSCNISCVNTKKNCHENHKVFAPAMYAKAYIVQQPYENLFNVKEAFEAGTIFKALYSPYCDVKYSEECTL